MSDEQQDTVASEEKHKVDPQPAPAAEENEPREETPDIVLESESDINEGKEEKEEKEDNEDNEEKEDKQENTSHRQSTDSQRSTTSSARISTDIASQQRPKLSSDSQQRPKLSSESQQRPRLSTDSQQRPKVSTQQKPTGQWSNYFKKALSNVENTLDKVLQESTEVSQSATPAPVTSTPPARSPSPALSTSSATGGGGRLTMQERLAMAVGRQSASPSPSVESDKPKPKSQEDAAVEQKAAVPSDQSQPQAEPEPEGEVAPVVTKSTTSDVPAETPSLDLCERMAKNLFEVVKLLDLTEERETIENTFSEMIKDIARQQKSLEDFSHQSLEKIDSLESKLKYLSRQEADRAKAAKSGKSGLEKKLAEKDEQIALLFEEGQMMSKKELKQMTTIKKLRAQEQDAIKQMENALKQKQKFESELVSSKDKLTKQAETIKELSRSGTDSEKILKERNQLKEKSSRLEQELADIKAKYDSGVVEAQTAALTEANAKIDNLQEELSKLSVESEVAKERYHSELSQVQAKLDHESQSNSRNKTELQEEIKNLEAMVEYYRSKSEEVGTGTANGSNGTTGDKGGGSGDVHLIRQIEVLQSQHSIATENWHGIEANLLARISALEKEAEDIRSKESYTRKKFKSLSDSHRETTDQNEQLNDRVSELDGQVVKLKSEINKLKTELDDAQASTKSLQRDLEAERSKYQDSELSMQSKIAQLEKDLQEANNQVRLLENTPVANSSPGWSKRSSIVDPYSSAGSGVGGGGVVSPLLDYSSRRSASIGFDLPKTRSNSITPMDSDHNDDVSISPNDAPGENDDGSSITASAGGASTAGPNIQLIGKMNTTIRRLESQLASTNQELERMTKSKDEACTQVAQLIKEQEEYSGYKDKVDELQDQLDQLQVREQTTLEALGEKSEMVNELRADVEDIKAAYKQQIEDLIDKLAEAGKL